MAYSKTPFAQVAVPMALLLLLAPNISAQAPSQVIIQAPTTAVVGEAVSVTLKLLTAAGTPAAGTLDVQLTANGSVFGTSLVSFSNQNSRTVVLSDNVAEVALLALSATANTPSTVSVADTHAISFTPRSAKKVVIDEGTSTRTVDSLQQVTILALDEFDNVANGANFAVGVRAVDSTGRVYTSPTGASSVNLVDSRAEFEFNVTLVTTIDVSLQDIASTALDFQDTASLTIHNGAAAKPIFLARGPATAGGIFSVAMRLNDQYGNRADGFTDQVHVQASGSATIVGTGDVALVPGGTLNVIDTVAETITLSIASSSRTGFDLSSTLDVVIQPGALASFVINAPASMTLDESVNVTVLAQDGFGNVPPIDTTSIVL
jgi:hypothetical protein